MTETNITRRRVVQGAGAIGVAGVFGSGLVSAQDGGDGGGQQGPAVRVAHMSPDAPQVDVQINPADGGQTDGGPGGNETGGDGTATPGGGGGDDDGVQIEGVGFREVSNFQEVEPGTYRVRILPAQGGILGGLLGDLFGGGGDDEQTVLYEDQLEVEENTTYTVAAFGEVSQGPIPAQGDGMAGNATDGGLGNDTDTGLGDDDSDVGIGNETDGGLGNETDTGLGDNETAAGTGDGAEQGQQLVDNLSYGESQTVEVEPGDYVLRITEAQAASAGGTTGDGLGNETDTGLGNDTDTGLGGNESDGGLGGGTGQAGGSERGFQVSVLEDDVSSVDGQARFRVFHAVPDVDAVSITAISSDQAAADGGTQPGNETGGGAQSGNETAGGAQPGNETAGGAQAGGGAQGQQEGVRQADVTIEENTAYTGFASGYFDPEEAPQPGDGGGDNQTGDGGGGLGGNDTGGNQTDGAAGEDVAEEPDNPEFEFVVVQDAQGGERSDGGTGGGFP